MTFDQLHLEASLLRSLHERGFNTLTPIQKQAIPVLLKGNDLLACAATGTGKTAAFVLPILQSLLRKKTRRGASALILVPTRELALQIACEIEQYSRFTDLRYATIIGGESVEDQIYLAGRFTDLIIATPGRLLHLLNQGSLHFRTLEWLILDEADQMLDMGFIRDIRRIADRLPRKRQTALFSATLQSTTSEIAKEVLRNPHLIDLSENDSDLSLIDQSVYYVDKQNKMNLLLYLLQERNVKSALVFVRTKYESEKIAQALIKAGLAATCLHGDKEQDQRRKAFFDFTSGKVDILVATDLAARGVDIPNLSYVFNYELPNEPETYRHRIGRTGRAGARGTAISLCSNAELRFLKQIRKSCGNKSKLEPIKQHPFAYAPREKGTPRQSAANKGRIKQQNSPMD